MMIPPYVQRPLRSLWHRAPVALPVSLLLTWGHSILERTFGVYGDLLSMDPRLIAMAVFATLLDTITGMAAAYKEGGLTNLSSMRFRSFSWKVIEYGTVIVMFNGIANAAVGTYAAPILEKFGSGSLFYVMIVEAWSLLENWQRLGMLPFLIEIGKGNYEKAVNEYHPDEQNS